MARNVEIKAHVTDMDALVQRAAGIADTQPVEIFQDDTFFNCANGRMKLRTLSEDEGQLVFYRRPDQSGPKESYYLVTNTSEPAALLETLSAAYGQIGRVIKLRTLYMVGRTRIHLDNVRGLGNFMELEVMLDEQESTQAGIAVAHELMAQLGIGKEQLIDAAYLDLLREKS